MMAVAVVGNATGIDLEGAIIAVGALVGLAVTAFVGDEEGADVGADVEADMTTPMLACRHGVK